MSTSWENTYIPRAQLWHWLILKQRYQSDEATSLSFAKQTIGDETSAVGAMKILNLLLRHKQIDVISEAIAAVVQYQDELTTSLKNEREALELLLRAEPETDAKLQAELSKRPANQTVFFNATAHSPSPP